MKLSVLAVLAVAAFACSACGGNPPPPAVHAEAAPEGASPGAAMAQGKDDGKHLLTTAECETLGEWIAEGCHEGGSRSARVEGWCSDVVARVTAGSWAAQCVEHVHRVDAACFLGSSAPGTMMACDRATTR